MLVCAIAVYFVMLKANVCCGRLGWAGVLFEAGCIEVQVVMPPCFCKDSTDCFYSS